MVIIWSEKQRFSITTMRTGIKQVYSGEVGSGKPQNYGYALHHGKRYPVEDLNVETRNATYVLKKVIGGPMFALYIRIALNDPQHGVMTAISLDNLILDMDFQCEEISVIEKSE